MFEYLRTTQGQNITAFVTVLVILVALAFGAHPFKNRWTAECYYNYLLAVINSSTDMLLLEAAWEMVENTWYQRRFRFPIRQFTRNRYYIKLTKAYAKKETELTNVKVELCVN